MKWSDSYRINVVLFEFVVAIVLGGGSANADFTFGEPVNLGPPINTDAGEVPCSISSDGLKLYLMDTNTLRTGNLGGNDIWVAKRSSVSEPWGEPVNLGPPINTEHDDAMPSLSADGLTLYFGSKRPGGYGGRDIWVMVDHWHTDDPFFDNGDFELHKCRFSHFNGKFISRFCGNECFGVWPKHDL